MQELKIEMTSEVIDRVKRDGTGSYKQQVAYAYTFGSNGQVNAHPEKIMCYRANQSEVMAPGMYIADLRSIIVKNYNLEFGRLSFRPIPAR